MFKNRQEREISNRYNNWCGTTPLEGKTNLVTREEFITTWYTSGLWEKRGGKLGDATLWFDPQLTTVTGADLHVVLRTREMLHPRSTGTKTRMARAQKRTLEEMAQISLFRSWKTTRSQEGFRVSITQQEWLDIWSQSGKWSLQGRLGGDYHVAYDRDAVVGATITIRDCQVKQRVTGMPRRVPDAPRPRLGRVVTSRSARQTWAHADDPFRTGNEDELRSRTPLQERINEVANMPLTNYRVIRLA